MSATHQFQCEQCEIQLQIPIEHLPASGPCPSCGHHMEVGNVRLEEPVMPPPPPVPIPEGAIIPPGHREVESVRVTSHRSEPESPRIPEARRVSRDPGEDKVRVVLVSSIMASFFLSGSLMGWLLLDAWQHARNTTEDALGMAPATEAPAYVDFRQELASVD